VITSLTIDKEMLTKERDELRTKYDTLRKKYEELRLAYEAAQREKQELRARVQKLQEAAGLTGDTPLQRPPLSPRQEQDFGLAKQKNECKQQ